MRYAVTIGLANRASNAEAIRNSFRWLLAGATAEWAQLYLHNCPIRSRSPTSVARTAKRKAAGIRAAPTKRS